MTRFITKVKIKTYGIIMTVLLVIIATFVVISSTFIVQQTQEVRMAWELYDRIPARKVVILSHLRSLLGYDGMIHHFKDFILRNDRRSAARANQIILEISIALTAYESLGLNPEEKIALQTLIGTLDKYRTSLASAERLMNEGVSILEIDSTVKINDAPAIRAMAELDTELFTARRNSSSEVYRGLAMLSNFITTSSVVTALFLLMLTLGTIWFVRWQLVRPLNDLVDAFNKIDPRFPGNIRLPFSEKHSGNELDCLAHSGNQFLQSIEDHLSQRNRAEASLKASEDHLRSIFEMAVDAIVTIDDKGLVQSFNRAAIRIFDYTPEEVIGNNVSMLMPDPYRSNHDTYLENYAQTGEAKIIGIGREVVGRRKGGELFPMKLAVSKNISGYKTGFTGIVRDISMEKEAELKVLEAKEAAEKANQAKSEFLSSMSHELRTPLNAVIGFAQLLELNVREPLTVTQQENVDHIMKGGHHLLNLINDLLNLAKIEEGKLELLIQPVNPTVALNDCLAVAESMARQRSISVVKRWHDQEVPLINSDLKGLKQVMLNLLSNAVKYNQNGGTVTVSIEKTTGGMLRIEVTDTGSGIAKKDQERVFEPFDRLGREATNIEGTGVGLAITKKLLETMGGLIDFESEVGKGSTFWVELPLAENT